MKSLRFEHITFEYKVGSPIFKDINFEINAKINEGHVVALMGASGTGKSTLFKLILQTEKAQKGKITFNIDNPVIAYVPQEPVLFEHLSPVQNARYFQRSKFYKDKFNELLYQELIQSLNLQEVLETSSSILELSGGQRQRLSLLRALSIHPDILLLDEPTTGLDAEVKLQFLNKLREIIAKYNLLVVYITHHRLEAELIADEILFLSKNNFSKTVSHLYQNDIVNFVKQPPLLDAYKVFTYPKINILKGSIENNCFIPNDLDDENVFYFGISEENISFAESGMPYDIVASNPLNTVIKFKNTNQSIAINAKQIHNQTVNKILIMGLLNVYDIKGEFVKVIELNTN